MLASCCFPEQLHHLNTLYICDCLLRPKKLSYLQNVNILHAKGGYKLSSKEVLEVSPLHSLHDLSCS
jgi:hypothetical protein